MNGLPCDCVLGNPYMKYMDGQLDYSNHILYLKAGKKIKVQWTSYVGSLSLAFDMGAETVSNTNFGVGVMFQIQKRKVKEQSVKQSNTTGDERDRKCNVDIPLVSGDEGESVNGVECGTDNQNQESLVGRKCSGEGSKRRKKKIMKVDCSTQCDLEQKELQVNCINLELLDLGELRNSCRLLEEQKVEKDNVNIHEKRNLKGSDVHIFVWKTLKYGKPKEKRIRRERR